MILIVESFVISLDIISSWADNNIKNLPLFLVDFLNASYFAMFFARALAVFYFTASYFKLASEKNDIKNVIINTPFIFSFLVAVTSPWTGLIYSVRTGEYQSGPLYSLVYFVYAYYLILCYVIVIRFKHRIKRSRHYLAIVSFVMVLTVGIILRKLMPHVLLMDTFCLIAVLIVYLAAENPEFYIEPRGSVFNSSAFRDYIDENNGRLHHKILGVVIKNYQDMRDIYGGRQIDEGIVLISRYFVQNFKDLNVFYYRKGSFILLGNYDMDFEQYITDIKNRFEKPWLGDNLELYLEIGLVYVELGERVVSADSLLNSLITAFDKVDNLSSDEVLVFSDAELKTKEEETVVKRYLERAVDNDKVEVFFQPLFDAKRNKLAGAEALCRVRDEKDKLIPPALFIPLAEKNGRINQLGEQVFEKTCKFIERGDMEKAGLSWINVNLSPVQFLKTDLADRYAAIAQKHGVDPSLIHLEITEESMIDEAFLNRQIEAMREKGFKFVLDDYGTGYSNVVRLKKCPFINVKLDMSLVRDYCKEPDEILPNMIVTFKRMGFGVTAEGIEDKKMADMMKSIGCDFLQGYYYSKPVPMKEFLSKYSV
ncbi:MAG: EAL domain-containing protein [Butyrivibrio sp.]|nr:EAL domain-containing protein [Butyrivibrio sp.]MBR1641270.1 EAL domain-containing protein [Butyrivibrio sp.]